MTEQTGTVSATYNYDPYGNPAAGSDPLGDTGLVPNPFGYAGQYTDQESGLQYLRARYYDPVLRLSSLPTLAGFSRHLV